MANIENGELDKIIHGALKTDYNFVLPDGLMEKTIKKLEKKALLRRLIFEFCSKTGLVLLCLAVLAGVFAGIKGPDVLVQFFEKIADHWQIIVPAIIAGLFTIIVDQIALKYLSLS